MKKYLIKEVTPEATDFSLYFDGDCFNENAGDFCHTLFIINNEGWGRIYGFNIEEYKNILKKADYILNGFDDVKNPKNCYNWNTYKSYKEVMEDFNISYTSKKCHALKEWAKNANTDETETIADFLTITTGHKWEVLTARGYSQGDYAQVVYCPPFNSKEGAEIAGDLYFGCGKEFSITFLEDGKEAGDCETVYGYFVADCQGFYDADYKRIVCEYEGIPEEDATLEMIENSYTITHYTYRTA